MVRANYDRMKIKADRMIRKFGLPAKLRSSSGDRDCWALEVQLSPAERRALVDNADSVYLISANGLPVRPNENTESLVTLNRDTLAEVGIYRFATPPQALAPGGEVIYWECQTRGQARVS